jgi:hypothetical protein
MNDDPRWTAALTAPRATFSAETQMAWALAHAQSVGLAGAAVFRNLIPDASPPRRDADKARYFD